MPRITKDELDELEKSGTDHVSLSVDFGTYEATFRIDGQPVYVSTESLNPEGDVLVREIDEAERTRLITESFRRSYW